MYCCVVFVVFNFNPLMVDAHPRQGMLTAHEIDRSIEYEFAIVMVYASYAALMNTKGFLLHHFPSYYHSVDNKFMKPHPQMHVAPQARSLASSFKINEENFLTIVVCRKTVIHT